MELSLFAGTVLSGIVTLCAVIALVMNWKGIKEQKRLEVMPFIVVDVKDVHMSNKYNPISGTVGEMGPEILEPDYYRFIINDDDKIESITEGYGSGVQALLATEDPPTHMGGRIKKIYLKNLGMNTCVGLRLYVNGNGTLPEIHIGKGESVSIGMFIRPDVWEREYELKLEFADVFGHRYAQLAVYSIRITTKDIQWKLCSATTPKLIK